MGRRLYNRRKAAGLCPLCGGTPTPGLITCEDCRKSETDRMREQREANKVNRFKKGDRVRVWRWNPPTLHGDPVVDEHLAKVHAQLPKPGSAGEIVQIPQLPARPTYTVRFRNNYRELLQVHEEELAPYDTGGGDRSSPLAVSGK